MCVCVHLHISLYNLLHIAYNSMCMNVMLYFNILCRNGCSTETWDRKSSSAEPEPLPTSANTALWSFPVYRLINAAGWLLPFVSWLHLIFPTVPTFMSDWSSTWRPTAAVPPRSRRAWRPSDGRSSLCCGSVSSALGTVGESPPALLHTHTHTHTHTVTGLTDSITRLMLPNAY